MSTIDDKTMNNDSSLDPNSSENLSSNETLPTNANLPSNENLSTEDPHSEPQHNASEEPSAQEAGSDEKDLVFVGYDEETTAYVDAKINTEVVESEEEKREKRMIVIWKKIRKYSKAGKLFKMEDFEKDSRFQDKEELESLLEEMKTKEKFADIVEVKGSKTTYFYSSEHMTTNYANIMLRIEDKDLLTTIAETVRYESKTYPRATNIANFSERPYYYPKEEVEKAIEAMKTREEFSDIQSLQTTDGSVFLFSTQYMEYDYAYALAQWEAVERFNCP